MKSLDYDKDYLLCGDIELLTQKMANNIDYLLKQIVIDLYNERRDFDRVIEKGVAKKTKINLFGMLDTDYETLNRLFGVQTKVQMIEKRLEALKYLSNLEKSGIEVQVQSWKDESDDIFVIKQILRSKQFWKMVAALLAGCWVFKYVLIWLLH